MTALTDHFVVEQALNSDLLSLIQADTILNRIANTHNGEYAGPCPFCGGHDRFRVQPNHLPHPRWFCRQCTNARWHTTIDYVMRREHVNFANAVSQIENKARYSEPTPKQRYLKQSFFEKCITPNAVWQTRAHEFVAESEACLWSSAGTRARAWLHARGLSEETLRVWRIGFNPKQRYESSHLWGLSIEFNQEVQSKTIRLPRGIVIPCESSGMIWYLKIRLAIGDPKYWKVRGGTHALFGAETLRQSDYVVVTEGEFDAILTHQVLQHAVDLKLRSIGVCTLGSAVDRIEVADWAAYLLPVARFYVCYDDDAQGARGTIWWHELSHRVKRVTIPRLNPHDKDLTDFHNHGGRILDLIAFEVLRDEFASNEKNSDFQENEEALTSISSNRDDSPQNTQTESYGLTSFAPSDRPEFVPCPNCNFSRFWRRPLDGTWVCAICHPSLPNCGILDFASQLPYDCLV